MRYQIVAIGGPKRGFYVEGCHFFIKRLGNYASVDLVELKEARAKDAGRVQEQESERLLSAAQHYLVALDEGGKSFSSRQLAARLSALELRGDSAVSLLIGGAEGHSDALKEKANELWRLSDLTLPHELARLVLLEQLYRAETIRAGHPYHRE